VTVKGDEIEAALARWPEGATAVKVRDYREIWRMNVGDRAVYLKWFPRGGVGTVAWAKRLVRGDPALREYGNLVRLQKAAVPSPTAVAFLSGARLGGRTGDAVMSWALEPSEPLDVMLHRCKREGLPIPGRRALFAEVMSILAGLLRAKLGHSDLHFGNFLAHAGRLHLLDAYSVHGGGMTVGDLEVLGHAAQSHATRTELLRGWRALTGSNDPPPPAATKTSKRQWRKTVERALTPSGYAGRIELAGWRGMFFKHHRFPLRHAPASGLSVEVGDWEREFPRLWEEVCGETLRPLKRSASGDVWAGEVVLGGVPVEVVVKRPLRSKAYRYVTEIGRGSRAWRAWKKSWMLIARGIPTAWPLLVMEKKTLGAVADQLIVCEKVQGEQLDGVDLDRAGPDLRDVLLRRVGRVLRRIDDTGIVHFDTKASNIMIRGDELLGPGPVLVDVDGVRGYSWRGEGLRRLDRSMRDHHPHFTETDAASLRFGYDPFANNGGAT